MAPNTINCVAGNFKSVLFLSLLPVCLRVTHRFCDKPYQSHCNCGIRKGDSISLAFPSPSDQELNPSTYWAFLSDPQPAFFPCVPPNRFRDIIEILAIWPHIFSSSNNVSELPQQIWKGNVESFPLVFTFPFKCMTCLVVISPSYAGVYFIWI